MAAVAMTTDAMPAGGHAVGMDEVLIARASGGDVDAFGELYRRHVPAVRRYLRSRLRDTPADAEDLTTEVFIAAMRRINTFRSEGSFTTWLIGIARRELVHRWRRRAVRETELTEWRQGIDLADRRSPEDLALERLEIMAVLARLSPRQRRAIVLRSWAGLRCAEVAGAMGITRQAVSSLTRTVRGIGSGERAAFDAVEVCACGCGAALPADRRSTMRYVSRAHQDRALTNRRRAARRLPFSTAPDSAQDRLLAAIEAAGPGGITRKALGRRTRLSAARMDRIVAVLAERGWVVHGREPEPNCRPVTRYYARQPGSTSHQPNSHGRRRLDAAADREENTDLGSPQQP